MTDDPLDDLDDIVDDDIAEEVKTDRGSDSESDWRRHWPLDKPTWPSTSASNRLGARIGDSISGAIAGIAFNLMLLGTRLMPGSWKMWRGFWRAGLKGMYKSSNKIDRLGHIIVGGQIKPVPLRYNHEENRYETIEDDPEWWETPAEADNEYRIAGSVPTVWASSRSNEVGSHMQAEVAEALDLGADRALYSDANVRHVQISADNGMNPGEAVADGGQSYQSRVTVESPGLLEDKLVPLNWDGDARVISLEKYYETYPSTEDPEKMDQQRKIGRLMEMDEDKADLAMKMLLIAGAIVVLSLAAAFVLPEILGGGGGGGGGGGSLFPVYMGWWL